MCMQERRDTEREREPRRTPPRDPHPSSLPSLSSRPARYPPVPVRAFDTTVYKSIASMPVPFVFHVPPRRAPARGGLARSGSSADDQSVSQSVSRAYIRGPLLFLSLSLLPAIMRVCVCMFSYFIIVWDTDGVPSTTTPDYLQTMYRDQQIPPTPIMDASTGSSRAGPRRAGPKDALPRGNV